MNAKWMKRLMALAVCGTLLLTGCGGGSSDEASAPAEEAPAQEEAPADEAAPADETAAVEEEAPAEGEEITLRLIESLTSPDRTALLQSIADSYHEEHPNITVEIISPPYDSADQKISQMLAAEETLDIVESRDFTLGMQTNNGWLLDITDAINSWEHADTYSETAKTAYTVNGKIYGIASNLYRTMLLYRKDILEEAGLPVPTTHEEYLEVATAVTDPSQNRYGVAFRGVTQSMFFEWIRYIMGMLGVDAIDPDNLLFTTDGSWIFETPEAIEGLKLLKGLFQDASPSDSIAWGYNEDVQAFISGQCVFLPQQQDAIAPIAAELDDTQFGTAPQLVGSSGQQPDVTGFSGWSVVSYSEHPQEAIDFIEYLCSPEQNVEWAIQGGAAPVHSNASEFSDYFTSDAWTVFAEMDATPEKYPRVTEPLASASYSASFVPMNEELQHYLMDEITEEDVIAYTMDLLKDVPAEMEALSQE